MMKAYSFLTVLLWSSMLHAIHMMPSQKRTNKHSHSERITRLSENDGKTLHRTKRGWMWNQFFLLEEYTGPDTQYVGKLHTDQDKGDGNLKYILTGDGAGSLFVIDENTGDIHAAKKLDREEKSLYVLRAKAIDRKSGRQVEPESEFIIKIHDINDNEPKFTKDLYTASIPEMSGVGTSVIQVTATDADDPTYGNSARVVYSILQGQPYFSVDPETGTYQFSSPESAPPGTPLGRIKANDPDLGENAEIEYSISNGDGSDMFDIVTDKDTQEGIITVKKQLDFEKKILYTLRVEATNTHLDPRFLQLGPFKDTALVKISVEDIDEPPVFSRSSYLIEVDEDAKEGSIIGQVVAQDPDVTKNTIKYSVDRHTDMDRIFNVYSGNGSLFISKPLDREETPWHNITVIATEINNPKQSSQIPVFIRILDINDHAPEFAKYYETFVCENAKAGQLIQTVSAVDKDEPPRGHKFFFDLVPEFAVHPNFSIIDNKDNTAGIITRRNGYSRSKTSTYHLPIIIFDNDYPVQSSTSTLTIQVCACDSRGNMQSCNTEALLLPAGLSTGALIAILLCIIILLVLVVLFAALKRQRKKEPLIISKDDVRDNIVTYNDEGGGEEDTQAFDIGTLRNPEAREESKMRRDVLPETIFQIRRTAPLWENIDVQDFIHRRLKENDSDPAAPPYDSLATYAYEGNDSIANSLSSLESLATDGNQDYDYLSDWGPRFKNLADMYGGEESDRD
ncbi:cadherin-9-like isoform X1 [Coturnix japonica]|uniref:Cadherin 9 n=1 Tax=Coturnix japonica TaxID=93934 RepID=A0A8C2YDU0_COTJA|nr:cadherin-9-like isoform X1 [Coturnix japonica]XP_015709950.1 cadherin-9-like isoform X1 [Coturnix japonica]